MANLIDEIVSQKAFDELERLKRELAEAQKSIEAFYKQTGSMPKFGGAGTATSELEKMVGLTKRLTEQIQVYGSVAGKALVEAQQAKRELVNETKLLVQQEQAEEGSIDQLRAKLASLTKQYEALGRASRESLGGKDLHAQIMATRTEVDKLEQSLGNYKRNVGNYTNATFQLSQVFRELPAFTFSAQTGVMALSNNLPMLMDAFKAVKLETGSTMKALGVFGRSIFSLGNIFTLAMSAFLIFNKEIMAFVDGLGNGKKAIEELQEANDILDRAMTDSGFLKATEQVASLTSNLELAKKGFYDKNEVVKEYNKTLGKTTGYAQDLNDVEQLLVKNADAYIKMMLYKTAANIALEESAKNLAQAERSKLKREEEFANAVLDATVTTVRSKEQYDQQEKNISNNRKRRQAEEVKAAEDAAEQEKRIYEDLIKKAEEIRKQMGFTSFGDGDGGKDKKGAEVNRIELLRKQFEQEKALLETQFNDGKILEEDFEIELIELTKKYTAQREGLTLKEKQTEADFNRDLSKIRKDILDKNFEELMKLEEEFNSWSEKATKELTDKYIKEQERKRKHNEYWAKEELNLIKDNIDAMERMLARDDDEVEQERKKALERLAIIEDYYKQFQELAQIYTDAVNAKERSAFDAKTEKMKEFYDEEEERIKRSFTNQKDRETELQKLSARRRAEEKALDVERKKILREQAIRQKKADVMAAISGAALMIIKQAIATPLPAGLPFILAAGVTGGIQVARAMAAPIPEFAKGTESSPEGYAVVGEKGHELVIEPSGKKWVTPAKDTITYLKKGSKVIPNDKLMTMVRDSAYVELANMNMPVTPDLYGKALVDQFERLSDDVKDLKAVMSNKDMRVNIVGNFDHYMHVKRNIK